MKTAYSNLNQTLLLACCDIQRIRNFLSFAGMKTYKLKMDTVQQFAGNGGLFSLRLGKFGASGSTESLYGIAAIRVHSDDNGEEWC